MSFLLGWDSIETTSRLHNIFEVAGIVILALLVLAEVAALKYGHRRDELIAHAESAAIEKREKAQETAQAQHDAETAQIRKELATAQQAAAEAATRAAEAKQMQAQRHLTEDSKHALIDALSPFAGQKVTVQSVMGDGDGDRYKQDFLAVLRAAKWNFNEGTDVSQAVIMPTPSGIQVTMNQGDAQSGQVLKSAREFVVTLYKLGIIPTETLFVSPEVSSGSVRLVIGTK